MAGALFFPSMNIQEDYVIDEDKAYLVRRKKSSKKKKGQKASREEDKSLLPQDDDEESYYYEYYDEGVEDLGFDDAEERKNSFSNNGMHALHERTTAVDLQNIAMNTRIKKKRTKSYRLNE